MSFLTTKQSQTTAEIITPSIGMVSFLALPRKTTRDLKKITSTWASLRMREPNITQANASTFARVPKLGKCEKYPPTCPGQRPGRLSLHLPLGFSSHIQTLTKASQLLLKSIHFSATPRPCPGPGSVTSHLVRAATSYLVPCLSLASRLPF